MCYYYEKHASTGSACRHQWSLGVFRFWAGLIDHRSFEPQHSTLALSSCTASPPTPQAARSSPSPTPSSPALARLLPSSPAVSSPHSVGLCDRSCHGILAARLSIPQARASASAHAARLCSCTRRPSYRSDYSTTLQT